MKMILIIESFTQKTEKNGWKISHRWRNILFKTAGNCKIQLQIIKINNNK